MGEGVIKLRLALNAISGNWYPIKNLEYLE